MASAGAEKQLGTQDGAVEVPAGLSEASGDHTQSSECPVMGNQGLVSAHEACRTQGEDKCPIGPVSEPELLEERLKLEEQKLKPEVEALEERGPRSMASVVRSSHGPKRKPVNFPGPSHQAHPRAEAELPLGLPLQREDLEPSPSAKQHKKAKKRKSLGAPVLPAVASTVSTPSETLGLEREWQSLGLPFPPACWTPDMAQHGAPAPALPRVLAGKAQRLRPLYQYINYCNPELNQEGDREAEAEVEPESQLSLVPEEACVEQLPALLPVAGELGSGLTLPCPSMFVSPTHALVPLGEETGEEPEGLPSLGVSGLLKTEMDKTTQVDINKMLSVCAAPLVPPLSPQYK